MEQEKKGFNFGILWFVVASVVFVIAVILFTNYLGLFKKKTNQTATASLSQAIPININNQNVIDGRVLYTFQGTVDKIAKVPGGYSVVFKNNPKEYFMPGGLNIMLMKSSGQTQVKPETVKVGDAITFSSVYNLKTRSWIKTYTAQDLKLLQKANR